MITITFDPGTPLIKFFVTLEYRNRFTFFMAFDPGASIVTITPEAATLLGCSPDELKGSGKTITASGEESVSHVSLKMMALEDESIEDVEAAVMPLPGALKIDGMIGLNFLRHFKVTLDVSDGTLVFERK